MLGGWKWAVLIFALASSIQAQPAKQQRIEVQKYTIDAQINPRTQSITATAKIDFTPLDDTNQAAFELNNALTRFESHRWERQVVGDGAQCPGLTTTVTFPTTLTKGSPTSILVAYNGKLTGDEDSPVYGIKFAALHPDFGYLLYPARWFPVNGYTVNRFAADLHITTLRSTG